MLELKGIGLMRDSRVLNDIDVTFSKAEIYGVIGKSGAGKTSLLQIASGFLDPTEGAVLYAGREIKGPNFKLVPGYDEIQLVNQDFKLDLFHTVEENIREVVLSRHKEVQAELIEEFLGLVELEHLRDIQARYISGGEQQRLALARALACEPEYILLDEPFVHLDLRLRLKILSYLRGENRQKGLTIILVSHDGSEMMGFVNQILYLDNGQIRRVEGATKIYYNPETKEEAELLGLINFVRMNGSEVMFRPNEYEAVTNGELKLKFKNSIDTGGVVMNYYLTSEDQEIVLFALESMNELNSINIKRYEVG